MKLILSKLWYFFKVGLMTIITPFISFISFIAFGVYFNPLRLTWFSNIKQEPVELGCFQLLLNWCISPFCFLIFIISAIQIGYFILLPLWDFFFVVACFGFVVFLIALCLKYLKNQAKN